MCTLFEEIARENETKGIEKGIEKGIQAMISTLEELQISNDVILNKICDKFQLTEEKAKTYLLKEMNWKINTTFLFMNTELPCY